MGKKQKRMAIAVDIGATNLRVALVREDGKVIKKLMTKTPKKGRSGKVVTDKVIAQIKELLTHTEGDIVGIGVSSTGPLDEYKGVLTAPTNIPFSEVHITEPIQKYFSIPTRLLNDANAAALGASIFGAGEHKNNVVYVTISTGIGGGVIIDGSLLHGRSGNVGEVGHMHVDTVYDLECGCGRGHGHWEAFAAGPRIPSFFALWARRNGIRDCGFQATSVEEIFAAAEKKEPFAIQFMEELGRINARGLSNIVVAYDPDVIIVGGSVAYKNRELWLHYARKYFDPFLLPLKKIVMTNLGDDVSLLGAAALAFEEFEK